MFQRNIPIAGPFIVCAAMAATGAAQAQKPGGGHGGPAAAAPHAAVPHVAAAPHAAPAPHIAAPHAAPAPHIAAPRQAPHAAPAPRITAPRRGTRGKRLSQRRGRLRIPPPGRAALSRRHPPRMAVTTPDRGKTRRRNQTRLRGKA